MSHRVHVSLNFANCFTALSPKLQGELPVTGVKVIQHEVALDRVLGVLLLEPPEELGQSHQELRKVTIDLAGPLLSIESCSPLHCGGPGIGYLA
jgi:hypothetical protein